MVSVKSRSAEADVCGVRVVHINRVNRAREEAIPDKELNCDSNLRDADPGTRG